MIWLVRHGETEMNTQGRFNGRIDSSLTPRGEDQARRLGARLQGLAAEVGGDWSLYPSPAGRALRTAALIAAVSGLTVRDPDPRLAECDFGSWEALTRDEIVALRPDLAGVQRFFLRNPDGESYDQLSRRARSWMDAALASPDHRVAVSHAGTGRMLRGLTLGLTLDDIRDLDTPQDVVFRLADGGVERFECAALAS